MSWLRLILRSLTYHWRGHLGVFLGASLASAVLMGALIVGDSVRGSLREFGLERLLGYHFALSSGDRFYRAFLFSAFEPQHTLAGHLAARPDLDAAHYELTGHPVSLLHLPGTAARQDQSKRANRVHIYGVPAGGLFHPAGRSVEEAGAPGDPLVQLDWEARVNQPLGTVILNMALAAQLQARPGDELIFRLHKPSALSRDAVISPRDDQSIALRARVHSVVTGEEGGNLSLTSSQMAPLNAFFRIEELDQLAGVPGLANLTLMPPFAQRGEVSHWDRLRRWWASLTGPLIGGTPGSSEASRPLATAAVQGRLLAGALSNLWTLADAELALREVPGPDPKVELITRRIFLDDQVAQAARGSLGGGTGILTYLVNQLSHEGALVPYSMVAAVEAPWVPADLAEDEVVVNEWLAKELSVKPGDAIDMAYYLLDTGSALTERTNRFRVRSVAPLTGEYADRTLMPEFPGLAKAESTRDWDAGFKLTHPIREQDEAYWKQYRGTPKAFIRLSAGQKLWQNRFGKYTALRFTRPAGATVEALEQELTARLQAAVKPEAVGLRFEPVREQALQAAADSQDFGGLFIGFSFFLIVAALILMVLLFQFGVEQRQTEVGLLLAIGFRPSQVRSLLWREALLLAGLAGLVGGATGIGYARGLLWALGSLWRGAVGTSHLSLHVTGPTLFIGGMAALGVCALTLWWVLRRQGRLPARALLVSGASPAEEVGRQARRSLAPWIAVGGLMAAVGMVAGAVIRGETVNALWFFGASSLALMAGLAGLSWALGAWAGRNAFESGLSVRALLLRGISRRRSRSLATSALLACGSFLVVSIGVHRLDATRDAGRRSAGTGGFALLAESVLPITQDLNSPSGREALGLDAQALDKVAVVPFRLRPGDDASCLNLNRAQNPRLLGVDPAALADRQAFTFAGVERGRSPAEGWNLLNPASGRISLSDAGEDVVPAIGDAASIQWALGKKLGDTLSMLDESGRPFRLRLVGGLANSVLQGNLIIHEREFVRRFPSLAGAQFFLLDAPTNRLAEVSAELSRGLKDLGLEAVPTVARLAQFNGVQNTYLNTFQLLGGLGLLIGSVGLGVVVLRNAFERRAELGLLRALGFRPTTIHRLLLWEHVGLLSVGLAIGVGTALVAVLPTALSSASEVPVRLLGTLLGGVFLLGLLSTLIATSLALRGRLLENLRVE